MNGAVGSLPTIVSLAERRVLDHIYCRQAGHLSPRALASLVARGLVQNIDGALGLTPSGLRALSASG